VVSDPKLTQFLVSFAGLYHNFLDFVFDYFSFLKDHQINIFLACLVNQISTVLSEYAQMVFKAWLINLKIVPSDA
jgi:hypothetical protein